MKVLSIFFTICILLTENAQSQDYESLLSQANQLMSEAKYEQAALKWDSLQGMGLPLDEQYLGVQCWALTHQTEKAFDWLLWAAKQTYCLVYDEMKPNPNLIPLHSDKRWGKLLKIVKKRSQNFDIPLMNTLREVCRSDQSSRKHIEAIAKKFGWDFPQLSEEWGKIHLVDSVNTITVTRIIDSAGWLGVDRIGDIGNTTLFLIIQHSELETQKKYLIHLKEAHRKKWKISVADIGYLEDRIAQKEGKPQIYGTQFTQINGKMEFYPIEDRKNVNKRRKKMGMGLIEEYAKFNNVSF
jgi:hypothetical protein